jgi:hypothetical protein
VARTALFLNPGADLTPALALARRAAGYESLWVTHGIGRDAADPVGYAHVAPHAGLGTGVIPLYPRTRCCSPRKPSRSRM